MNPSSLANGSQCTLPPPNELLLIWARMKPNEVYLRQIIDDKFKDFTYMEVAEQALRLVSALTDLGAKPRDKIALISKNCAEWFICDLAIMLGDFISVPLFPTAQASTIEYCLTHSDCHFLIAGKLDDNTEITQVMADMSTLTTIALPYSSAPVCQYQFVELIAKSPPSKHRPQHQDDTIMSIVYTSGTSGTPKGSILTYGSFAWTSKQIIDHIGINSQDRLFSYLPLAHITERVYIFGSSIMVGIPTAFPESLDTFIDNVKMHRPTLFISVPRLWHLFQQRILDKIPNHILQFLLSFFLTKRLIRRKIIRGLGLEDARVLGCGSAPVSPSLLHWYNRLGLEITEAWGMTESLGYGTLNYPFIESKIGTVGRAGPGVELHIAEDGEVMMKTQGMFAGYYHQQSNEPCFDEQGWLHTGDIGSIDEQGYLTLLGRKKDTFKTAKGKFVAPVPIEKLLYAKSRVEMLCLIGSGHPSPILLVVPHPFPHFDKSRYERRTKLIIEEVNQTLEPHAKVKRVLMVANPWSIENGFLTPTLKIKRFELEKHYQNLSENWPEEQLIRWESDEQ